jgi:hypothetical protein
VKNQSFSYKVSNKLKENRDYKRQKLKLPLEVVKKKREWAGAGKWEFDSIKQRQFHLAEKYAPKVWKVSW